MRKIDTLNTLSRPPRLMYEGHYTFLETKIQRLLDGLIVVEKGLGVHMQRMLKMSRFFLHWLQF